MNLPQDIANQALASCFWPSQIGDLNEGTFEARVIVQFYSQCLRQLLRAAHWSFARKEAALVMLADASGQTPDVGTVVNAPFQYSFAYPNDCMKMRFVPARQRHSGTGVPSGNIAPANNSSPTMTGLDTGPQNRGRERPARWLEGLDTVNAPPAGVQDWTQQGVSPQGRTAIFTNVKDAHGVYTALINYPAVWDPLFRAAFVAYLASEIAPGVWSNKDRKFGMQLRTQQMAIAKDKIVSARAASANEGWSNSDLEVDWMDFRRAGNGGWDRGYGGGGPGYCYAGCDDCCGAGNTSAY